MDLPLTGETVHNAGLDGHYTVVISTSAGYQLSIETEFRYCDVDGPVTIDPQHSVDGPNLERLDRLVHLVITSAEVDEDGRLTLRCGDNAELVISADQSYEAWNLAGATGVLVVSTPGGELATWAP